MAGALLKTASDTSSTGLCVRELCPFETPCTSRSVDRLLEGHKDPAAVVCAHDHWVVWRNAAAARVGVDVERDIASVVDDDDRERVVAAIADAVQGVERVQTSVRMHVAGGAVVRADVAPLAPGGERQSQVALLFSPCAHEVAPSTLEGAVLDRVRAVAALSDMAGVVRWTTRPFDAMCGASSLDPATGRRLPELLDLPRVEFEDHMALARSGSGVVRRRVHVRHGDATRAVELCAERIDWDATYLLWWVDAAAEPQDGAPYREALETIARELAQFGIAGARSTSPLATLAGWDALSDRERMVVRFVAEGLRVSAIANRLYVSESTVRNYLSSIYRKTATESLSHLRETLLSGGSEH